MNGTRRWFLLTGLASGLLLVPAAGAYCGVWTHNCTPSRVELQAAFIVNPVGLVTLDVPAGTIDAERSLVAQPGQAGQVFVELYHPPDEANATSNVTVGVGDTSGVAWKGDTSFSFVLNGTKNLTFPFAIAGGAPEGPRTVFVNVTANGALAVMQLTFKVAEPEGDVLPPMDWLVAGVAAFTGSVAGAYAALRRRLPR